MLDKSPRRLAIEIKGKDIISAENHLIKFGAKISEATAADAMCAGLATQTVVGTIDYIEYWIEVNCHW